MGWIAPRKAQSRSARRGLPVVLKSVKSRTGSPAQLHRALNGKPPARLHFFLNFSVDYGFFDECLHIRRSSMRSKHRLKNRSPCAIPTSFRHLRWYLRVLACRNPAQQRSNNARGARVVILQRVIRRHRHFSVLWRSRGPSPLFADRPD